MLACCLLLAACCLNTCETQPLWMGLAGVQPASGKQQACSRHRGVSTKHQATTIHKKTNSNVSKFQILKNKQCNKFKSSNFQSCEILLKSQNSQKHTKFQKIKCSNANNNKILELQHLKSQLLMFCNFRILIY